MTNKELIKECYKRNLPPHSMILEKLWDENEQLPDYIVDFWLQEREPQTYTLIMGSKLYKQFNEMLKDYDTN